MNEIVNKFLLAGDKFMSEIHLKLPGFTYNACGLLRKSTKKYKNLKETGDSHIFIKTN